MNQASVNMLNIESRKREHVVKRHIEVDREELSENGNNKSSNNVFLKGKNIQRNITETIKKRKRNDDCVMYGFYRTEKEMLNPLRFCLLSF